MTVLSVNLNKVALLRNSRGHDLPNVLHAARTAIAAGARGITMHPRPDARHATHADIRELKAEIAVELNVEGYPAPAFLDRAWRMGRFVDRPLAEQTPDWKQWIPYCVLRCRPPGSTPAPRGPQDADRGILRVQRTKGQSEARLHGSWSIGIGGHVEPEDQAAGAEIDGGSVTTIEGVAERDHLHPLQQSFLENAALQCGICTPGFIVSARALLEKNPSPTEHEARLWLAGNLCRCTGYDKIIRAVLDAAKSMRDASAAN